MAQAFEEQTAMPDISELSFEDRLSLLLEREKTDREQRRYQRLKGHAKLHLDATIEDLDFKAPRGLDRSLVLRLASGQWIRGGQTVLVSGATGSGKSYLACAFGHQACRLGISTRYYRVSRLLDELTLARGDGSYPKLVQRLDLRLDPAHRALAQPDGPTAAVSRRSRAPGWRDGRPGLAVTRAPPASPAPSGPSGRRCPVQPSRGRGARHLRAPRLLWACPPPTHSNLAAHVGGTILAEVVSS